MPSLIIPDTRTMPVYPGSLTSYENIIGCLVNWKTEDAPDGEGGTISRGEYLVKTLFGDELSELITFDEVTNPYVYPAQRSCGMYIDPENTDGVLSWFASTQYYSFICTSVYEDIRCTDEQRAAQGFHMFQGYAIQNASNYNGTARVEVKIFDSFVVIMYVCQINNQWRFYTRNGNTECVYEIWDRTNNEIIAYNGYVDWVSVSTPEARNYAQALTKDGAQATMGNPVFRQCSIEEVSYAPLTRIDGIEATRMYLLTQFPENCIWETLHVGDKYFLVLPYNQETNSVKYYGANGHEMHCAIAIDVTEDIENQD